MHPVLCQIGPLHIFSYGLMLAVAVVVCSLLLVREAPHRGLSPDILMDLVFWAILFGIIGARVFFIFLNLEIFVADPLEIVKLQHGGLAFQGGLIGGFLAGWIFMRLKKMAVLPTLDLIAPFIALGHSIGRIGCFLNGCCYGRPVSWGIYFPVHHERLHPTQLYESFGLLLLFFFLKWYEKRKHADGEIFFSYLVLAAALRFVNEFLRADHADVVWGLSIFQLVSIGIFIAGLYGKTFLQSRRRT